MELSSNEETLLVSLVCAKADATYLSKFMLVKEPDIYYIEKNNWVLASADYMLNHIEHESYENKYFWIHGMPKFNVLGELFEVYGMEGIDFQLMSVDIEDDDDDII
ncbi:hypothetical protein C2S52_022067 [Perilla frutescens var. hirtella]|nr:hypothetical protein C2S52_022067 [Perilla frutescens var. hirtella]